MKFMLFVCADRAAYDRGSRSRPPEIGPEADAAWADELDARGIRLHGGELGPDRGAVTVRVRAGEVVLGDGPFAETKEVIAGYDIIDCADVDEAVAIAARHPVAARGAIEIRPLRA